MDTQITPYQKIKSMLATDEIRDRFQQVMGSKANGFIASVLNTVYLNDNLRECEPNSIITSALTAAVLDLPVDPNLGFSYLIPYREKGNPKARFQMGYKGYIQLAMRSCQYEAINVSEIYEGEQVKVDRLTGKVVLNGHRNGNAVIGYVAYFRMINGFEKYYYMSTPEITTHAEKYSQSWNKERSIWHTNFDAMAKKTVLKALIAKYGIMSIQMQNVMRSETEHESDIEEPISVVDAEPSPAEQQPAPFDPAAVLVEEMISENTFAASGLLKNHIPDEIKTNREALVKWGKIYRGWRDSGMEPAGAKAKADAGEVPA